MLGVSLADQIHRRALYKSFCRVCEKLGLPTRGFSRMVDVYLLHAGVPMALLPTLIRAFLRQEAAFGPPPTQATVMLNRWEDDSLEFLPHTVVTPRRAILWDETAWHAALYAKIRQSPNVFAAKLPVEERFFQTLSDLQNSGGPISVSGPDASAIGSPKPRLIWRADGLALRLPRVEGRIQLWQDEDASPFRLRGGEDWMLQQPWPALLRWRLGEHDGVLHFLPTPEELAIFDRTTGYMAKEVEGRSGEAIRDLLEAASDNRVILRRGNGTELLLFEIVPSIAPISVRSLPARDSVRLRLNLMSPVDALALEVQHEHRETEFVEAGFGRRPVSSRRPSWLSAELPNGDPTEVELTVSALEFEDGLALARIFLRPEVEFEHQSTWRPLRNARGDTYAIVLGSPDLRVVDTDLRRRFETLSKWLADCYAVECWSVIERPLISRWEVVGEALAEQPGGLGSLMMAAAVSPPDHAPRTWVPMMHPVHFLPGLTCGGCGERATSAKCGQPGSGTTPDVCRFL